MTFSLFRVRLYTNSKAGEKYKSAAQGLITLATYGIGMLIGFWVAGIVSDAYKVSETQHDWEKIWMHCCRHSCSSRSIILFTFSQKKENSERSMKAILMKYEYLLHYYFQINAKYSTIKS
jgi:hypothetical protein